MQGCIEHAEATGRYEAVCLGPNDRRDGERIAAYVAAHPELIEEHQGRENLVAAEILGIELHEQWRESWDNVVCTVGKNLALDTYLAGAAYTVTGPFMGLISSVSWSAVAAGDTMGSHAGWLEAGNANAPQYSGTRKTAAWNAASGGSKSLSAALSFGFTSSGTVKGAFLVFGSGALNTIDNTAGTLYSAGLFASGDRAVLSGDTLNVSWTGSL